MARQGIAKGKIMMMRKLIRPVRALWAGERDPHELADEMPLVFVMSNPTGSERTFYCGYDPITEQVRAYDYR